MTLTIAEREFSVAAAHLECKRYTELAHVEEFVPSVIEPSMGIGRILYTVWEHSFRERDAHRNYLAVPLLLAPYKCSLLPLSTNDEFRPLLKHLAATLTENGTSNTASKYYISYQFKHINSKMASFFFY